MHNLFSSVAKAPSFVGFNTVEGSGKFLGRDFAEHVEACQDFNVRIKQRLADNNPELLESILTDFKAAHQTSQSRDTQNAVVVVKK
jgi:hypothetical protein